MRVRSTAGLSKNLSVLLRPRIRRTSTSSKNNPDGPEKKNETALPPEPNHCCMSGCPNCVWIKYAQELAEKFDNGDDLARQKISEKVKDPTLRAFLFATLGLRETGAKSKSS